MILKGGTNTLQAFGDLQFMSLVHLISHMDEGQIYIVSIPGH